MVSSTSLGILLVSMGFFGVRSFFKGAWHALFSLLGLVSAYIVSFFVGPAAFKAYSPNDPASLLMFGGGMMALFIAVSFLVSNAPLWAFPKLREVSLQQRIIGGALGCVAGVFCGLVVIWLYGVLHAMAASEEASEASLLQNDILVRSSSKMVSGAVRAGISAATDDPYTASATTAMVTKPHIMQKAMDELSSKPLLQEFWQDGESQFSMAEGDVDGLIKATSFRRLMEEPAVKTLIEESKPEDASREQAERYMAGQMSFVWRRMRTLRTDPRVIAILEDKEVRGLVDKQNPVALIGNEKVQELISIVMEPVENGEVALSFEALSESDHANEESSLNNEGASQALAPEKTVLYRWVDDTGRTRYTDENNTPEDKKASAKKIAY